jgi:hypothetical protein
VRVPCTFSCGSSSNYCLEIAPLLQSIGSVYIASLGCFSGSTKQILAEKSPVSSLDTESLLRFCLHSQTTVGILPGRQKYKDRGPMVQVDFTGIPASFVRRASSPGIGWHPCRQGSEPLHLTEVGCTQRPSSAAHLQSTLTQSAFRSHLPVRLCCCQSGPGRSPLHLPFVMGTGMHACLETQTQIGTSIGLPHSDRTLAKAALYIELERRRRIRKSGDQTRSAPKLTLYCSSSLPKPSPHLGFCCSSPSPPLRSCTTTAAATRPTITGTESNLCNGWFQIVTRQTI